MYHWFVARKVRATFAQISTGDWEPMIAGMAPRFSYRFYGDSALSGERHTLEALRLWWARSFRLLPRPAFQVDEVSWPADRGLLASPPGCASTHSSLTARPTRRGSCGRDSSW